MFQGFFQIEDAASLVVLATNSAGTPVNLDALPTYRVYAGSGLIAGQTGSLSFKDSGSVTGATNANPIVVTSAGHGLTTGTRVTLTGVGGNTNANTTTTVTVLSANTFSLDGVSGNSAYTSGGTWNVTGLYKLPLTVGAANGYAAGETYTALVQGLLSAAGWAAAHTFGVV